MRKIKYIDVGNMSHREAQDTINKVRADIGMAPIETLNTDLIFYGILAVGFLQFAIQMTAILR